MRNATGKEKQDIVRKMQGEGVMTFTRLVRGCALRTCHWRNNQKEEGRFTGRRGEEEGLRQGQESVQRPWGRSKSGW